MGRGEGKGMGGGGQELADDGEGSLPGSGEVLERCPAAIENRLRRQRAALVDVEKGLMTRVVRKHERLSRHDPRRLSKRARERQLQRAALGDDGDTPGGLAQQRPSVRVAL